MISSQRRVPMIDCGAVRQIRLDCHDSSSQRLELRAVVCAKNTTSSSSTKHSSSSSKNKKNGKDLEENYSSGFYDHSQMTRVFKANYHMTPSAYRKQKKT